MTQILRRACAPTIDLEVRSDARLVVGIAVPWETPAVINDPGGRYHEVFKRGAFSRTLAERGPRRVKVLHQHRHEEPLGRAEVIREDSAGLYTELRISQTRAGDEVLEQVRDGTYDSLSIGFVPVEHRRDEATGWVERTAVSLREISVVTFGAYDGARITAVRHDPALAPTPLLTRAAHAQRLADLRFLELM